MGIHQDCFLNFLLIVSDKSLSFDMNSFASLDFRTASFEMVCALERRKFVRGLRLFEEKGGLANSGKGDFFVDNFKESVSFIAMLRFALPTFQLR